MAEKILSCFIDESGDFGPYDFRSPYYYVAMVLHDQSEDISEKISVMESRAANNGYPNHAIHTGPLIRRENVYINEQMEDRKHLFNILYFFTALLPIRYFCAKVNKAECSDDIQQTAKLSRAITTELQDHLDYWSSFDKIIVYYDNGQTQLTRIITSVFNTLFSNVEMRKVRPVDYKLFQVADLICTLEMLSDKAEHNGFSKSETDFFGSIGKFRKDYYKKIVCNDFEPQGTLRAAECRFLCESTLLAGRVTAKTAKSFQITKPFSPKLDYIKSLLHCNLFLWIVFYLSEGPQKGDI